MQQDRYLEPNQARQRPPTDYENLLGDTLERAFAAGVHDLPGLVAELNRQGPAAMDGTAWTEDTLRAELARLGA